MKNNKAARSLFSYTAVHFMVDFACFYYLMGTFSLSGVTGIGTAKGFLLYNVIAFGLQFLIGWCFDGRRYTYAGIIGLLLIILGIGMDMILGIPYKHWLVIILVLMALGNAFFHVAGGMDSLLPALLCFGAIILRGYLGTVWNVSFSVLFMAAIATCVGKAMGGFLADAFGGKEIGLISMCIAAFCFSGLVNGSLAAIIGIVCFNLTMPITYYTLYRSFVYHPGFACGLNCLGLVIGASISCFVPNIVDHVNLVLVVGMLVAAVFVYCSAPAKVKGERI